MKTLPATVLRGSCARRLLGVREEREEEAEESGHKNGKRENHSDLGTH